MKNIKFYQEYDGAKRNKGARPTGNCIGVLVDLPANPGKVASFAAVYDMPNCDTNFGEVSTDYIRLNCKRVSEQQAKIIHPKLYWRCFAYSKEEEGKQ